MLKHVFFNEEKKMQGSEQYLYFCESENEYEQVLSTFKVQDEYDHSVFYIKDQKVVVTWFNKSGTFQFCGSGAYAIATFLLEDRVGEELLLKSDTRKIKAVNNKGKIHICFTPKRINQLRENIFYDQDSGVGIIRCKNKKEVSKRIDPIQLAQELDLNNISALCLFFYQEDISYLRYFSPWYGRDEDYVTGSIQAYLSPLIQNLYGVTSMTWEQLSPSGGEYLSVYKNTGVELSGTYK